MQNTIEVLSNEQKNSLSQNIYVGLRLIKEGDGRKYYDLQSPWPPETFERVKEQGKGQYSEFGKWDIMCMLNNALKEALLQHVDPSKQAQIYDYHFAIYRLILNTLRVLNTAQLRVLCLTTTIPRYNIHDTSYNLYPWCFDNGQVLTCIQQASECLATEDPEVEFERMKKDDANTQLFIYGLNNE